MSQAITADQIQAWLDETGMIRFMGITLDRWDPETETLILSMPMRDELQGGAGAGHMHGGAVGAFIDTAATFVLLASGVENCPTVNYRVDLMRPVVETTVKAVATIRRRGRSLAVTDVDVFNDDNKLVAVGRATFAILD